MSLVRKAKSVSPQYTNAPPSSELLEQIAVRAYYKAEARGFVPGHETEDWLAAEAEIGGLTKGV